MSVAWNWMMENYWETAGCFAIVSGTIAVCMLVFWYTAVSWTQERTYARVVLLALAVVLTCWAWPLQAVVAILALVYGALKLVSLLLEDAIR